MLRRCIAFSDSLSAQREKAARIRLGYTQTKREKLLLCRLAD